MPIKDDTFNNSNGIVNENIDEFIGNGDKDFDKNAIEMLKLMTQEARGGKKEKITAIIGAGFSQTAGFPDGLDLRDKLYDHWELSKEEINRYLFKLYRNKFSIESEEKIKRLGTSSYDLSYRPDGGPHRDPNITFEMVCSVITESLEVDREQVEYFLKNQLEAGRTPLGYEILAHLVNIGLVDDVISLNFDTLFEKALDEEIGKSHYSLIVSDEEFKNAMSEGYTLPPVMKPHGSLEREGSILFTTKDVLEFNHAKDNLLAHKLSNSSIIIIGCSCSSPDIQKLLRDVASRDYTHCIYWIMREEDKDKSKTIGDFGNNLRLILTEKKSVNNLDGVFFSLINKINSLDVAGFGLIKLERYEIKNFFWGKGGIQEIFAAPSLLGTAVKKLLLEIIIFSVTIKKDFTEEDLLACPRIVNLVEQLIMFKGSIEKSDFHNINFRQLLDNETIRIHPQDTDWVFFNTNIKNEADLLNNLQGYEEKEKELIVNLWQHRFNISPRKLLDRLVDKDFLVTRQFFGKTTYCLKEKVFKLLGDAELERFTEDAKLRRGNAILNSLGKIFDFKLDNTSLNQKDMEVIKKMLYSHFHRLVENYDFELANEKFYIEIHLSYYEARIIKTKAQANQLMKKWLENAKEVRSVSKAGRWILRDFAGCINNKAQITLFLVEDTLKHRLLKLGRNVTIKLLKERNSYDLHKKRFTIIETTDGKKFVLYTLRKGKIGCMFWSEHPKDAQEANEYFRKLSKEAEIEKVKEKEKREVGRKTCQLDVILKPQIDDNADKFTLNGTAVNISPEGFCLTTKQSAEIVEKAFSYDLADIILFSKSPKRYLHVEGSGMWFKDDGLSFSSDDQKHQLGLRFKTNDDEKNKEISTFLSGIIDPKQRET